MDDQNIKIYVVSRSTPEYVVIGPNWYLRLVTLIRKKGEGVVHGKMLVDKYPCLHALFPNPTPFSYLSSLNFAPAHDKALSYTYNKFDIGKTPFTLCCFTCASHLLISYNINLKLLFDDNVDVIYRTK